MSRHDRQRLIQIAILLPAARDGAVPERPLLGAGLGNGLDHRQGQLAFAEVVAHVLADCGG